MATLNVPARMSLSKPGRTRTTDRLASSRNLSEFIAFDYRPKRKNGQKQIFTVRSMRITQQSSRGSPNSPIGPLGGIVSLFASFFWLFFSSFLTWVVDFMCGLNLFCTL